MQQVLHYSALKTGVAYIALTLTIIVMAGLAQALSTRFGVRPVLAGGMFLAAGAIALYAQLPVHGQYFWDLFPAFLEASSTNHQKTPRTATSCVQRSFHHEPAHPAGSADHGRCGVIQLRAASPATESSRGGARHGAVAHQRRRRWQLA